MSKEAIITEVMKIVKTQQLNETSGHDWWHTLRVYNTAVEIVRMEKSNINQFVVELGALLHDVADHKFGFSDDDRSNIIFDMLKQFDVSQEEMDAVVYIANHISFKGGKNKEPLKTIEAKIVQDADRLDAIGAIGIARAFTFGGYAKRNMYNPELKRDEHGHIVDDTRTDTIQHFYEKLLHIKNLMNTEIGRKKAQERHEFMEQYLQLFYEEWNGTK